MKRAYKNNKPGRKLTLSTETLRTLTEEQLKAVGGGLPNSEAMSGCSGASINKF